MNDPKRRNQAPKKSPKKTKAGNRSSTRTPNRPTNRQGSRPSNRPSSNAQSTLGKIHPITVTRSNQKKTTSISLSGNPPAAQETWWSQKFIQALESFKFGNRLIRGREYANDGRVQKISLEPGMVTSLVSGSRKSPYFVSISLEPFPESIWKKLSYEIAKNSLFVIEMLQDRMPESVEDIFQASRLSLFPTHLDQLYSDCDCPDKANPCKHIAATYYILAQHFDLDPFLIFTLRGRTKTQILEFLQYFWKKGRPKSDVQTMVLPRKTMTQKDIQPYWQSPPTDRIASRLDPLSPSVPDSSIKKMGPAPILLDDEELGSVMAEAYQAISETIREWAVKRKK